MNREKEISFVVRLTEKEWDEDFNGWRCSTIRIPGAEIEVYNRGRLSDRAYEVSEENDMILWRLDTPRPESLAVLFKITESLSTQRATNLWKGLAIALPFIAAILSPILLELLKFALGNQDYRSNAPTPPAETIVPSPPPAAVFPTPTPSPSPTPESEMVGKLTQEEALNLVEDWLEAKSNIFAPPFDKALLGKFVHTDGPLYKEITSPRKGIDSLKSSDSYYTFQSFDVEFWSFLSDDESPELTAKVFEKYTLHTPSTFPKQLGNEDNFVYTFKREDESWKIDNYVEPDSR